MKKVVILCIAAMFLLTSCATLGELNAMKKSNMNTEDKSLCKLLDALNKEDSVAIKSMFSEKALADAVDFDDHLYYLFDFFEGNVLSWERKGSSTSESKESGRITKDVYAWYQVDTDKQSYLFIFIECLKDTEYSNNVGLYTLRVIRAEDKETLFRSWEDIEIPGIYKPE